MRVSIVVGNPKSASRTRRVAETLVEKLFSADAEVQVIDLADHASELFAWPSETMQQLNTAVAESDVAVFATPTYKASYTGLLKAFLDRYPANGLRGVVALPIFTGADQQHSMGPDVNLVPLLLELGAIVPGRGLYFVMSQYDHLEELVAESAAVYADNLRRLAAVLPSVAAVGEGGR